MSNSDTGPGARLDMERDNLHAYCDRLEAENATLQEQLAAAPGAILAGGTMVDDITPDQLAADLARCKKSHFELLHSPTWTEFRQYIHALRSARERIAELEELVSEVCARGDHLRRYSYENEKGEVECVVCERDALAQRLAQVERERDELARGATPMAWCENMLKENRDLGQENADLRRQLDEAREWIRRFRDAEWDDTLRRMQFQAGDYLREQDQEKIIVLAAAPRVEDRGHEWVPPNDVVRW